MRLPNKDTTIWTLLLLAFPAISTSETFCTSPDGSTYIVDGKIGIYAWDDHGVDRSWALTCNTQQEGSPVCHRWEEYGDRGRSVMIFQMLPNGDLLSVASWAVLDHSTVNVAAGFNCSTRSE